MTRPTNKDLGKQSRTRRVPIQLTDDEYEAIAAAAARAGLQVSPFIRAKALDAVRAKDGKAAD